MTPIKRLVSLAIATFIATALTAQTNGSNSSYSRFGLGTLNDQSQGFNRGMAGVAQGFREGTQVNLKNPASYSAIDSLTFLFDAGMSVQMGRFVGQTQSGGTASTRAFNASLDYVTAGMRIVKGLGLSFGFLPYSSIGYNFTVASPVANSLSATTITSKTTYSGNGGLHQMYLGIGWRPFADLSIGANISYLWSEYSHSLTQKFYEDGTASSTYNTQNSEWSSDIKTYKIDLGVQYPIQLNKDNMLTLGATASIGHSIGSDVNLIRYTSQGDTLSSKTSNAFDLPYSISVGAAWNYKHKLTLGADYTQDRWSGCKVPVSRTTNEGTEIVVSTNEYKNRHHIAVGAEYMPHPTGRKYGDRIRYKVGASYSSSYIKVNGYDGPTEYGLTAGVALPISMSTRSLINVSLEWMKRTPSVKSQIKENYFMVHLGITFNERWFAKWKLQ